MCQAAEAMYNFSVDFIAALSRNLLAEELSTMLVHD